MLDRIWSSTQRLEDLDWFGPEMPYVQYRGWCSYSIALEPRCSKFRGELYKPFKQYDFWESNL